MTAVTAAQEDAIWIDSEGEQVFAVLTHPERDIADLGVLLLPGGGWMPSTMRNRMYVDLARRLAGHGATVLRLDYQGVGESTGETPYFDLTRPASSDVVAAARVLTDLGCERLVVAGACYGGRAALTSLADDPALVGLLMSATPVEDYAGASQSLAWHARKAFSAETMRNLRTRFPKYLRILRKKSVGWLSSGRRTADEASPVSPDYSAPLLRLVDQGVACVVLQGSGDRHYPPFEKAMSGPLGDRLKESPNFETEVFEGELHGELTFAAQQFAAERVERLVVRMLGGESQSIS